MDNKPKVYFRADGNSKIGLGHVMRSLALAEILNGEFDCFFVIQEPEAKLLEKIFSVCLGVVSLNVSNEYGEEAERLVSKFNKGDIIVLDGYTFLSDYQKVFKKNEINVACIDDLNSEHFLADVVINHAGGIESSEYSGEPYTKFYLGVEYALLRKPFREAGKKKVKKPDNLFICMGGADPENYTLKTLKMLEMRKEKDTCYLVIGSAYSWLSELKSFLNKSSLKVVLLCDLSAEEIVLHMNQCRRAITSPSTISYEYLSTGGVLFLQCYVDNQKKIFDFFLQEGLAFDVNQFGSIKEFDIQRALKKQNEYFDGLSDLRLIDGFKALVK